MKIENIASIINNVESRFRVDEWTLNNIHIWPLIRLENYALLCYKTVNAKATKTNSIKYFKKIILAKFERILANILDNGKNQTLTPSKVVFLSDGVSFTKLNNKWYEKFCDPVRDFYLSNNIKSFRFDLGHNYLIPRYSSSVFIQTAIDNIVIKSKIRSKIKPMTFEEENWADYDEFLKDDHVKNNFIRIPNKNQVRAKIYKFLNLKQYYINYLKEIKPEIAFIVSYYGDAGMAFLSACKELGIKTFDIQHGVQGDLHLAYGRWLKVPKNGYESIPDYFLVWSEDEKKVIDNWNGQINVHKAIILGNLFANMWKGENSSIVIQNDQKIRSFKNFEKNKNVLLTLSPNTNQLMEETWKAVAFCQTKFNWLIRLHPTMIQDLKQISKEIKRLGIWNFEIVDSSTLPLYSLLRNVDAHITSQSSCVLEAVEFGIQSIITSDYGKSLYEEEVKNKDAYFAKSKEDICKILDLICVEGKLTKKRIKNTRGHINTLDHIKELALI